MLRGKTPLVIAIVLGLLAGSVAYLGIQREKSRVKAGWNLVPVIVAAQDLPEGTVVGFEMLSQRPIPEQFVTNSVLRPEEASVMIGAKVSGPVQAGDPVTWQSMADGATKEECEKVCAWAAEADPARKQKIREGLAKLKPAHEEAR